MIRLLIEIVRSWLIERRRDRLAREIRQARIDFQAGRCPPKTPEEIIREILREADTPTAHGG